MAMLWFRTFRADAHNRKLQELPLATFRALINLRCIVDHLSGELPSIEDILYTLRCKKKEWEKHRDILVEQGFLRAQGDTLAIAEWNQRQSDCYAENKQKQRLNDKRLETSVKTCPDDVLPQNKIQNQNRIALSSDKRPRKSSSRTKIHPSAQPDTIDREAVAEFSLSDAEFRQEWAHFRAHHAAKGSLMADWNAAWRTWLSNFEKGTFARRSTIPKGHESNFTKAARDLLGEIEELPPSELGADGSAQIIHLAGLQPQEDDWHEIHRAA